MNRQVATNRSEDSLIAVKEPRVSIVTVCYNEMDTIARCVESVFNQTYANIQYVVVDGASVDGTVDILEGYGERIDCLISEKDEGIYSAMNKALDHCSGDLIYFLNADDYMYANDTVEVVAGLFLAEPSVDILSGRVEFFNTPIVDGQPYTRIDFSYRDKLDLYRKPLPQQCYFVRKELFELYGRFNQKYDICADYEWLVRMMNNKAEIKHVKNYFCNFDYTGVSNTESSKRRREKNLIILRNSSFYELLHYGFFGVLGLLRGFWGGR